MVQPKKNGFESPTSAEKRFVLDASFSRISVESRADGGVISFLNAELKEESILQEVENQIIEFIKQQKPKRVVLDFKAVKFMSSMMIRSLIRIRDWVVGNDGQLKLANVPPHIREIFRITQLEGRLFFLYDSIGEALGAF